MNQEFWTMLEDLVRQSDVVIDRPNGSAHPKFPDTIYPVDYGYLQNTTSMDGEGIDVWVGTAPEHTVDAIVCVVDAWKRDSEMKILIDSTSSLLPRSQVCFQRILCFGIKLDFIGCICMRTE